LARHGHGKTLVDTFIVIPQRLANCGGCGTTYNGPKDHVTCRGCGRELKTQDVNCTKKVPTGIWQVATMKSGKPRDDDESEGLA